MNTDDKGGGVNMQISPAFCYGFFATIGGLIARDAITGHARDCETPEFVRGTQFAMRLAPAITARICLDLKLAIETANREGAA